ncbi:c-type cytochrome [Aquirufa ecclesiirivi]|uniref:c-type cytochrome n=1 Tax=Aquirufa ecclesiirivi TaxID=2715124 RepID=UPI0023D7DE59|nr:c-type cytochrome [Aquirufa ecclesiirivi]MDF0694116.1 c-type cytochrome [Aquirufa ecclesiirivi]
MYHSKLSVWAMLGFGLAFTLSSCNSQENKTEKPAVSVNSEKEIIQRGEYLVTTMGCNDCHSPKKMGPKGPEIIPELLLSGYPSDRPIVKFDSPLIKQGFAQLYPDLTAAAGPWGVSFAANLTPDETGIGNWSEDQFKMALTKGKYKGLEHERMLLPPMPWFNFVNLKDEDAHAMFQYLKSLKPVKNVVPMLITPDKM